jgi:hypothetical protein
MPRTGEREVIAFTPPKDFLEVYKALVDDALANLDEWCVSEEPENLRLAIKSLKVLQLYSAEGE